MKHLILILAFLLSAITALCYWSATGKDYYVVSASLFVCCMWAQLKLRDIDIELEAMYERISNYLESVK